MEKRLSKNAYGGVKGKDYVPFTTDTTLRQTENTGLVLVIGIILAVLFAASTAYSGMKTGLTVAAGIPGAVVGASLLKAFRKDNILSPTLLQGMASGGESIASGIIFVLPAVLIIGADLSLPVALLAGIGGSLLGIAVASMVQENLLVEEHGVLSYPEAMAISETLVATGEGGEPLKFMLIGSGIGAIYTLIGDSFKNIANKYISFQSASAYRWKVGLEVNPMLIGLGFIVGLEVALDMMAGSILAAFLVTPVIAYFVGVLPDTFTAWNNPDLVANTMSIGQVSSTYTKYIGAGAMLGGGFIGVFRLIPTIVKSMKEQFSSTGSTKSEGAFGKIIFALGIVALIVVAIIASNGNMMMLIFATLLSLLFIVMFVIVAGRLTGTVGTSNLPVSGMTIASLVVLTIFFVAIGATTPEDNKSLLIFASVIVTAISAAGGYLQSQKVSFIMGGNKNNMLKNYVFAAVAGVITVISVILLCSQSPTFVQDFQMPQANLMATLTQGILDGNLPWTMIFGGIALAVVLFIFKLPIMSVAIGFYLPMDIVGILFVGALLRYFVEKAIKSETERESRIGNGISMSAGLVVGSSLVGILGMGVMLANPAFQGDGPQGFLGTNTFAIGQLVLILVLLYFFIAKYGKKK